LLIVELHQKSTVYNKQSKQSTINNHYQQQ